jgi:hypothetical protein
MKSDPIADGMPALNCAGLLPDSSFASPFSARFASLLAAILAVSCGGSGGGSGASSAPPAATSVQVSTTGSLSSACGLATGITGARFTSNSAVQPQLGVNPGGALQLLGVWEQDRWNAIGTRAINVAITSDGGSTWSAPTTLPFSQCGAASGVGAAYDRASDPSIALAPGGIAIATALAFSAANYLGAGGLSAVLVSRSTDGGSTWSAAQALLADSNGGTGTYYFNDRDMVATDPNGNDVYVVWDRIASDTTVSEPTWLAHSADAGATWDAARVIYDPGAGNQTFNNQARVLPDGGVVDIFTVPNGFNGQLYAIRSTDHGTTWPVTGAATLIANMEPVGTSNPISGGPPIRDSMYMAQTAVDSTSGKLAAVWQESSFTGGARDGIALSISSNSGATWSTPVQVNTDGGVAAFDPSVAFGANGRIAVTYYDFRDYQAGASVLATSVWLRQSADGGTTWTETRIFGPFNLNLAPPADQLSGTVGNALFLGDQQGLSWNGTSWVALFAATNASGARVFSVVAPAQ